ncbi:hypothetical protein SLS55_006038 [Diplodia seriata]|uniref:Uncharacterized protein n=1 Tax=Diplodia seriata TaxID=420778 RepID=A0ABR3CE51_9PEZI
MSPGKISAHWKWVIMLAVIFLAMIAFSILGVWLKRRHRARRDAQRSNLAHGGEAGPGGPSMTGAIPPPPPMAHLKNANDSGTLASTLDLSSTTAGAGAAGSAEAVAGRPRSRTNTLTRFPNGSMSNVGGQQQPQPQPVVWGPHQHQAATRGYEYHNHGGGGGGGSPGPSVPPSPVNNVPTPSLTPVGGYSSNNNNNNNNRYNPGGSSGKDNAKSRSRDVTIDEMADEEEDVVEQAPAAPVPLPAKEKLRRKLSKR